MSLTSSLTISLPRDHRSGIPQAHHLPVYCSVREGTRPTAPLRRVQAGALIRRLENEQCSATAGLCSEFRVPGLEMRVLHLKVDIEDVHQRAFRAPERESRILQPDISLHLIGLSRY